jgi:hypothetical protein
LNWRAEWSCDAVRHLRAAEHFESDPNDGIGGWSRQDLANAMLRACRRRDRIIIRRSRTRPIRAHEARDIGDLYAFMKTLPAVAGKAPDHRLSFPFNIRRGLGLWKAAVS